MGVLDARYNAEKVGYSIIGEKTKEDPNVIDYNINEEITKDTSAILNANNDTTTGMATVIPGVNAPKLIQSTSIITRKDGYVSASIDYTSDTISPGDVVYINNGTVTITNLGEFNILQQADGRIVIPVAGYYHLDITLPTHGSFHYWNTTITSRSNRGIFKRLLYHEGTTGSGTDVIKASIDDEFTEGATISRYCEYIYVGSGTGGDRSATLSINISKLG